jgi:hypothetical protein
VGKTGKCTPDVLDNSLKDFHRVIDFGLRVSLRLRGQPTDDAGYFASIIHTKMSTNAISMETLCRSEILDHSAVMTICRMIIEGMTLFYYLIEKVEDIQWQCRELVLKLHDSCARIKLLRAHLRKDEYQDISDERKSLQAELNKNSYFQMLPVEQQKKLLTGEHIFVGGMRAAATRAAGWREENFIALYNYFSSHSHSAPMSFMRFNQHKVDFSEPSEIQRNMVAMAINVAEFCLLRATMHRLVKSPAFDEFRGPELDEFEKELHESKILTGSGPGQS